MNCQRPRSIWCDAPDDLINTEGNSCEQVYSDSPVWCNIPVDGDTDTDTDGDDEPDTDGDESETSPNSCEGKCGGNAGNCWCNEACFVFNNCCDDVCEYCPDNAETNSSFECHEGDVYWYDSCGNREEKKEECELEGCSGSECPPTFSCTDSVCTDLVRSLEWQQEPTGGEIDWDSAKNHCQGLPLDGGSWRLPNISELRSLIRYCANIETGGACGVKDECLPCGVSSDEACLQSSCWESGLCSPDTCPDNGGATGCYWPEGLTGACSWYWSSSPVENYDDNAWGVHFGYGSVGYRTISDNAVRCVR